MKKLEYFLLVMMLYVFAGCEQDAIDELRKDIDEQGDRLSVVEAWLRQTNSNIVALQELIQAKQQGKTIVKVIPNMEGYTIKLSDGTELVIRHGAKGDTGEVAVPVFGVRDSTDGNYYWTINGVLLKGTDGKAVIASGGNSGDKGDPGDKGEQGEPGITPLIRINNVTNEWEISQDGGVHWVSIHVKATGEQGDKGEQGNLA